MISSRLAGWLGSPVFFLASFPVISAETANVQGASFSSILQAFFGLAVVLALLFGFFWLLRRFGPTQMVGQGAVKVVGGVMLGTRERLVVVEVQDTWLLVGVAAGNVNLLHKIDKPEGLQNSALAQPLPIADKFAEKLSELLKRQGKG